MVSIVISYFNLHEFIDEAVASAVNQTYKNMEVIVMDDCSTVTKSVNKIEDLKSKYPSVKFFRNSKNLGSSGTYNKAIKMAKGKYISCLDGDDKLDPTYLEKVMECFTVPKIGFATSWIRVFGLRSEIIKTPSYDVAKILAMDTIASASVFSKKVWEEVGGFDPEMKSYRDWDFWLNLVEKGYRWSTVEMPLIHYRDREGSSSKLASETKSILMEKLMDKHKGIYLKYAFETVRELHKYIERITMTKGWKLLEKVRLIRNKFFVI